MDDCYTHFNNAKLYQSKGEIPNAIKEIELALIGIDKVDIDTLIGFCHPNNEDNSVLVPTKTNLKAISSMIHFHAAELYAMVGDTEKSLYHYQF